VLALTALGAPRLLALCRMAIAKMLEQGSAECLSTGDIGWMESFTEDVEYPDSWSEIDQPGDGGTQALLTSELRPALDAHFERHRAILTTLPGATSS
jgi:hypothetical protein